MTVTEVRVKVVACWIELVNGRSENIEVNESYLSHGVDLAAVGEVGWLRAVGGVDWHDGGLVDWCVGLNLGGVVDWGVVAEKEVR